MKHIIIDARIRQSSTGKPIEKLLEYLQDLDKTNRYTVLLGSGDNWKPTSDNFNTQICRFKKFSVNPVEQVAFSKFLGRLKPDLVHFGMTPQEPVLYSGKRITMTHDLTMFRYDRHQNLPKSIHRMRMLAYGLLFWLSLRKASKVIAPTQFVADDVTLRYPFTKNKIVTVYEASEPPIIEPAIEPAFTAKFQVPSSKFLLHVGSPFPHKNIDRLVTAFEVLKTKHADLMLVLAGKKEYYFEELEKHVATSPFHKDIIMPGFVSDAELKWLYQNATMYVLPSLSEGFGLPGLEAMAHGCPLASSNATCLPEVYGSAAAYFDPEDVNNMVDVIDATLGDPKKRKELVQAGYTQLKKYSWRRMAEETLVIYQNVLR